MLGYYTIYKAKEMKACEICNSVIGIDQFYFRAKDYEVTIFKLLCARCIQPWLGEQIQKLQNRILDFKNVQGKACQLAESYKAKKPSTQEIL